jgi:type IV fimbrial biogenesis protein FimT
MRTMLKNNARGFTLLELMVVLAIAGFLLGIGVPAFQAVIADQRSTTATNELVQSLILARSEAIKRGRYVSICKSDDGASCTNASDWEEGWIIFVNQSSATPGVVNVDDEVIRAHTAIDGKVNLTTLGNIDNFISFRPVGTTGTTALNFLGTLKLCDESGNTGPRGLLITPSGRVQISRDVDHQGNALICA